MILGILYFKVKYFFKEKSKIIMCKFRFKYLHGSTEGRKTRKGGGERWDWECYPINFSVPSAPPCFRVKIRVQILV